MLLGKGRKEHAGELIISQESRHGTEKRYSSSDDGCCTTHNLQFFRIIILSSLPTIERENRLETAFRVEGGEVGRLLENLSLHCNAIAIAFHLVLISFHRDGSCSFSRKKKCEKAGHLPDTCPRINPYARAHGEEKAERLCKWRGGGGGGLEASTPFAYIHPCSPRWINTFFFPTLENHHQGKCLLRRFHARAK